MRIHNKEVKIGRDIYTFYIAETKQGFFQVRSDNKINQMTLSPIFSTKAAAVKYAVSGTHSYLEARAAGLA